MMVGGSAFVRRQKTHKLIVQYFSVHCVQNSTWFDDFDDPQAVITTQVKTNCSNFTKL